MRNWQSDPTLRHKQPSYMWVMCGLYAENVCQQDNVRGKNKLVEWKASVEHNYDQKELSDTAINLVACEHSRFSLHLAAKAKRHWRRGARKNGCICRLWPVHLSSVSYLSLFFSAVSVILARVTSPGYYKKFRHCLINQFSSDWINEQMDVQWDMDARCYCCWEGGFALEVATHESLGMNLSLALKHSSYIHI